MSAFSDCPTCKRPKTVCDESAAHGRDACCMTCDERGRAANHAVVTVEDVLR